MVVGLSRDVGLVIPTTLKIAGKLVVTSVGVQEFEMRARYHDGLPQCH